MNSKKSFIWSKNLNFILAIIIYGQDYWMVHAGLIIMIFYATFVYGYRPTWKSMFKSFGMAQVYFITMLLVNYLLGANYAYLNAKPEVASILDLFGPWPWYVIQGQGLVLPFFCLIYLPFFIAEKVEQKYYS